MYVINLASNFKFSLLFPINHHFMTDGSNLLELKACLQD